MKDDEPKRQTLTFVPFIFFIIFALIFVFLISSGSKHNIAQNEKTAVKTLKVLQEALNRYKNDNGFYPSSLSLLASGLISTKYLEDPDIVQDEYPLAPPEMLGLFMYSYSGYRYIYGPRGSDKILSYSIVAFPIKLGRIGRA